MEISTSVQRKKGGFTIFHVLRLKLSDISTLDENNLLKFFCRIKTAKSDLETCCPWGTRQESKNFFYFWFKFFDSYSYRTRRADHEYHVFNHLWPNNKQSSRTMLVSQSLQVFNKKPNLLDPKFLYKVMFGLSQWFGSSLVCHLLSECEKICESYCGHWFNYSY